ncbi:MAG: dimethylmenaquinone methyltransferase [Candidatus Solibacter sp.]|nr:dimethylmenaquinone methyltransferase [Candidatus Solibacter sp.]
MIIRFSSHSGAGLLACAVLATLAPAPASAQLWSWTKDQMTEYTKAWTGDRFPDGRPKVPDALLERARGMSTEEISVPGGGRGGGGGGYSQYADGWMVTQPGKKMVGRAFTVQFIPARTDLDAVVTAKAKEKGVQMLNNQYALDMLQPGDVLVVDLFGKKEGGTIVGDNLFYYVMKATKNGGMVIDGSIRDLEGIAEMAMPAYGRSVHPSAIGGATLSGINIPIRIGNVTVMPGDVVVGDREGVSFIPPQALADILDRADTTHIHDEWTRKKFDEGKYKSSEIYGSPRDPALIKEYKEYLQKRLDEIRKK